MEARALTGTDLDAAVAPMVRAFWGYPETVHLLPGERRRAKVLPRYLLSDARDACRFGTLFGVDAPSTAAPGAFLGAAAWIPPEAYPVSLARQVRQLLDLAPVLPWGWAAAAEGRRGQRANREEHRVHPPHFYLRAIGVDPAAQGKGIGAALMAPVLAMADERGTGCFLQTATAGNAAWYARFGFTIAATYRPTPTWPTVWAMWRAPRTDPGWD